MFNKAMIKWLLEKRHLTQREAENVIRHLQLDATLDFNIEKSKYETVKHIVLLAC